MRRVCSSTGSLLIATGLLHLFIGLLFAPKPARATWDDGVLNAVDAHADRENWFWYMISGWLLLLTGQLTRWIERRTGAAPAFLGWHLLAIGVVGIVLMPVSGFWVFLPQAFLVLRRARRAARPAGNVASPRSAVPGAIG